MINNDVLIYDIETWTHNSSPNPKTDELRCLGAYSYKYNKYYFLTNFDKMRHLFEDHQVLVAFNNKKYDDIILRRYEVIPDYKYIIDLWDSIHKRRTILRLENESLSLSNLAKIFNLEQKKQDNFDYKCLEPETKSWSEPLKKYIMQYTIQDIKTTKKLFEYLVDYFDSFMEYMSDKDQITYKWISSSPGSYAYKVVCHLAGFEEEYNDGDVQRKPYPGGYVTTPSVMEEHGDIFCLDFNSAYPHSFMMANLFSPGDGFIGNTLFPIIGCYDNTAPGVIENIIKDIYKKRLEYKKNKDKREQALKLIINTLYGITGSPVFTHTYKYERAYDCTLICREMIKHARTVFKEAGYKILYTDTDSVYLKDVFNDETKLLEVKDQIIKDIKSNLPFPQETFDMGIDARIKHIYFFKDSAGKKLKKHYIYVTEDDKIVVKGIPAIKNDSSRVGWTIIQNKIFPMLKQGKCLISREDASEWISEELSRDITQVARKFRVKDLSAYKTKSSIQAQVSKEYGPGTHLLIPNNKYGVGKSTKYCTYDEFKQQGLSINDLKLDKYWKEMRGFIER